MNVIGENGRVEQSLSRDLRDETTSGASFFICLQDEVQKKS